MANNKEQKPLTLDALASYNQEILFPWMKENFVGKREFNDFKFKNTTTLDKLLKKLDILLTEKTIGNLQKKREKKFWAIIVKSLQEHQILSSKDLQEISKLRVF